MIWLSAVPLYATPSSSDPFAAPLDVQRQEAALLPSFADDLATAEQWDRYTVQARIDPEQRVLAGLLRLEYTNRAPEALERIYFYLFPNLPEFGGRLEVRRITVDGAPVQVRYESNRFLLRLNLPTSLPAGASATVMIDFSATAPLNASQTLLRGVQTVSTGVPGAGFGAADGSTAGRRRLATGDAGLPRRCCDQ
jgi:hypothetical protein